MSVAQLALRVLLHKPLTTYGHAVRSSGRASLETGPPPSGQLIDRKEEGLYPGYGRA